MRRELVLAVAAVLGLALGSGLFIYTDSAAREKPGMCRDVEQSIRQNKTFNGTVDCFEPGVINVSLSENVRNASDLRCVCRNSVDGEVQYFPITVSD
ncbi:MAG: hypothetical protein ABEK01_00195 [Candidatus Nanohaloarchaea archaeon]